MKHSLQASFAKQLAIASGEVIMPYFRTPLEAINKGEKAKYDPVTEADKAGEAAIRKLINKHYPTHGIIGEEYGSENENAEFVWVLDPIDGTKAFICGFPVWGTLIGLLHNGKAVFGMMHQPFTKELFWGDGKQAFSDIQGKESRLKVNPCLDVKNAILSTTSPLLFKENDLKSYKRVENAAKFTRFGGDCYAYAMLAAGQLDMTVEAGLAPYDIVAHIPILQGAGGIITTWDGKEAENGGKILATNSQKLHEEVMGLLTE
jgi:myo-inositol-1(or 4)-monophosphatase